MSQQIIVAPSRRGRPTEYSVELAAEVCEAIASGMILREVARLPNMPSTVTIFAWIGKHPEFREMYECALMARFDLMCEELKAIIDNTGEGLDDRVARIKTRQWIMQRRLPRVYADAPQVAAPAPQQQAVSQQLEEVPWLEERRRQREAAQRIAG